MPEIRERCAESTWQKFNALTGDAESAVAAEGVTSDAPDAHALTEAQYDNLRAEVVLAVREGLDEASQPAA